eukprot:107302-Prorocentrum_lima.AAC.1
MEGTTQDLWRMLCQRGLPLWKLNSENKRRSTDTNKQQKSVGVWRCVLQDSWIRNVKKEWEERTESTTRTNT